MPDETSTHAPYELTYAQPQPTTFVTRLLLIFGGLCRMLVIVNFCCLHIYAGHGGDVVGMLVYWSIQTLISHEYSVWHRLVVVSIGSFIVLECSNFFSGVTRLILTLVGLGVLTYLAVMLWRSSDSPSRALHDSICFFVMVGITFVLSLVEADYFRRQRMKIRKQSL